MGRLRCLTALLYVLATPAQAFTPTLTLDEALATASDLPADSPVTLRLAKLAQEKDLGTLVAMLADIRDDPAMLPARRARLLHQGAMLLATLEPDPPAKALLQTLASRPPDVLVWHEDSGHRVAIPWFDAAAAARHAIQQWARSAARSAALNDTRSTTAALLEPFATRPADSGLHAQRRGIADAFEVMPEERLLAHRDAVIAMLETRPALTPVAVTLAQRLKDPAVYLSIARYGAPQDALAIPALAVRDLASADAYEVLVAASGRSQLASTALLAMAELADRNGDAIEALFARLADRRDGGSAATALARIDAAAVTARLADLLRETDNALVRGRAALALRLSGSDAGARELARFADSPDAPPEFAAQIRAWLER